MSGSPGRELIGSTELVELSYTLDSKALRWIGLNPFEVRLVDECPLEYENYEDINVIDEEFQMPTHCGTHIDAPKHFFRNGVPVDELPLDRLFARPIAFFDLSSQVAANRQYELSTEDIHRWERINGRLPGSGVIVVRTGLSRYWGDMKSYSGTEDVQDPASVRCPGLSVDAAKFLTTERDLVGIGIEALSIDIGNNQYGAHVVVLSAGWYILENLGPEIARLPPTGALLYSFPLRIRSAGGAPVRVVAQLSRGAAATRPQAASGDNSGDMHPSVSGQ